MEFGEKLTVNEEKKTQSNDRNRCDNNVVILGIWVNHFGCIKVDINLDLT